MKRSLLVTPALLALMFTGCGPAATTSDSSAKIARGKHLVEGIGMCHDCHTPTGANGEPDMARALTGATLPFRPTIDIPWTDIAPAVAGLPTMNDADAVRFFMTGDRPGGVPARPPMPRYKMAQDEAEAVVAYLRSLAPKG
jgi:mono/diheme cytochrome c family protein